jgi:hypothetical protein
MGDIGHRDHSLIDDGSAALTDDCVSAKHAESKRCLDEGRFGHDLDRLYDLAAPKELNLEAPCMRAAALL